MDNRNHTRGVVDSRNYDFVHSRRLDTHSAGDRPGCFRRSSSSRTQAPGVGPDGPGELRREAKQGRSYVAVSLPASISRFMLGATGGVKRATPSRIFRAQKYPGRRGVSAPHRAGEIRRRIGAFISWLPAHFSGNRHPRAYDPSHTTPTIKPSDRPSVRLTAEHLKGGREHVELR